MSELHDRLFLNQMIEHALDELHEDGAIHVDTWFNLAAWGIDPESIIEEYNEHGRE